MRKALVAVPLLAIGSLALRTTGFAQGGAGGIMLGFVQPDLQQLNDDMSAAGYEKYSNNLPGIGGWGAFFGKRILIGGSGWGFWQVRESSFARARLTGGSGFFDVGCILARTRMARLAALAGIGGGGYTLELLPTHVEKDFGQILLSPSTSSRMTSGQLVVKMGVQLDRYLATFGQAGMAGVTIGMRVEYLYALTDPEWKVEDSVLLGAPDLDLSGLAVRLLLGFGGGR